MVFGLGLFFFTGMALAMFLDGNPYLGWFFVAFALLQLWALVAHGFTPLDDATKQSIDSSDPTKFRPFRFWK